MRLPKEAPKEQLDFLAPTESAEKMPEEPKRIPEMAVKKEPEPTIEAESLPVQVEEFKKEQLAQYQAKLLELFNKRKEFLAKILEVVPKLSKKEIKDKIGIFVGNLDALLQNQQELQTNLSKFSQTHDLNMTIVENGRKRLATEQERMAQRKETTRILINLINSLDLKADALDSKENETQMQEWIDAKNVGRSAFPPKKFKDKYNQFAEAKNKIDETFPQVQSILNELFKQKKFSSDEFKNYSLEIQKIESDYAIEKLNPDQDPQRAADEYFAEIFEVIEELAGEAGIEGLIKNMEDLARAQYRLTHEIKSSISREDQELSLPVKPQEYSKTGEQADKTQVVIGASMPKPGPNEFIAVDGQFGWVSQSEFRYEGPVDWVLLRKIQRKSKKGKTTEEIKPVKIGFKNQELADHYFLLLEGLQETKEQRGARKQSELKTLDDIFSYLAGEKALTENAELDSAQEDLLEMRQVFALSREWNKMPDWESFVKKGRYAYHSEKILKDKAGLSLEQAMLIASLEQITALSANDKKTADDKKTLAKYYSKYNQLDLAEDEAVLSRWQSKLKALRGSLKTALYIPETLDEIKEKYLSQDIIEKIKTKEIAAEADQQEQDEALKDLTQTEERSQELASSALEDQDKIEIARQLLAAEKKVKQEKERVDKILGRLAKEEVTVAGLEQILEERRDRLVETGLLQKTWSKEGKLSYTPGYKNDVFLIPSFDGKGRICGIRFRLIEPELSYYDDDGKKQTVETNGNLETLDNKYRSYKRARLDNEPESLALRLDGGERLVPKKNEKGKVVEPFSLEGQEAVLTEGEIKSRVAEELTKIPHLAIRGTTQVDDETIQDFAAANLKQLTLVPDKDPQGGAQQRGYQENDAAVAFCRIGERLEQARVPVKIVIWPEEYGTEQFGKKVGIDDQLLGFGNIEGNKKEYQAMLDNAVSLEEYRQHLNKKSYEENPYFKQHNKLDKTVELYYNTHQRLRKAWEKCSTVFDRGGKGVDEKKVNIIKNCIELLRSFRNQATEFYLDVKNLDRPASMFESVNSGLVPEEQSKFIFDAKGREFSIEGMRTNVLFHKFLSADVPAEAQLANGETLEFYDPDYEKNLWLKATALDIDKAQTDSSTEHFRKIRSDILLGFNARGQFDPQVDWQALETICQNIYKKQKDIVSPKDLLVSLVLSEFNIKHKNIVDQCFAETKDADSLKNKLKTQLDQFIDKECKNRDFQDISNCYVIGSYFVPKFSQKEVEYVSGAKIAENQEGAIAEKAELGDFAIISKKSGRVISIVEHGLDKILDQDKKAGYNKSIEQQKQEIELEQNPKIKQRLQIELDNRLNYYYRQVQAMNQDIYITANAIRESYNKERKQYRQVIRETVEYAKAQAKKENQNKKVDYETNHPKAVEALKQTGISRDTAEELVQELEIIYLSPKDFFSSVPRENEKNLKGILSKKGLSAKAGEAGLYDLSGYLNVNRFLNGVLAMPIKTDPSTYVGFRFIPAKEDLAEKDSLFLERALADKTGQEVFHLQGVAQESQRSNYFYNQQALADLPEQANRAVICFDEMEALAELGRRKQEKDQEIREQNKESVVLGLNHSFSQLNEANLRKLISRGIREFVISVDDSEAFERANSHPYFTKPFDAMLLELYSIAKTGREIAWKKEDVVSSDIVVKLRTPDENGNYIEHTIEELLALGASATKKDIQQKEIEFNNRLDYREVYEEALKELSLPIRPPEYLEQIQDLTEVDFAKISKEEIKDPVQRLVLQKFARLAKRLRGLYITLNSEKDSVLDIEIADKRLADHFVELLKERVPDKSPLASRLNEIENLTDLFKLKLQAENNALPVKPVFLDRIAGIKKAA